MMNEIMAVILTSVFVLSVLLVLAYSTWRDKKAQCEDKTLFRVLDLGMMIQVNRFMIQQRVGWDTWVTVHQSNSSELADEWIRWATRDRGRVTRGTLHAVYDQDGNREER